MLKLTDNSSKLVTNFSFHSVFDFSKYLQYSATQNSMQRYVFKNWNATPHFIFRSFFLFDILKALGWEICPHFVNERQFETTPDIFHVIKVQGIWNGICLYGIIILICLTVTEDQYVPPGATVFCLIFNIFKCIRKIAKSDS